MLDYHYPSVSCNQQSLGVNVIISLLFTSTTPVGWSKCKLYNGNKNS